VKRHAVGDVVAHPHGCGQWRVITLIRPTGYSWYVFGHDPQTACRYATEDSGDPMMLTWSVAEAVMQGYRLAPRSATLTTAEIKTVVGHATELLGACDRLLRESRDTAARDLIRVYAQTISEIVSLVAPPD
jgi:hypothetical protein